MSMRRFPSPSSLQLWSARGGMGEPCYKVDGDKSHDMIRLFKEEQTWRVANTSCPFLCCKYISRVSRALWHRLCNVNSQWVHPTTTQGGQWCEPWNGSSKAALVRISCCFWNVFCFIRESFQFLVIFYTSNKTTKYPENTVNSKEMPVQDSNISVENL